MRHNTDDENQKQTDWENTAFTKRLREHLFHRLKDKTMIEAFYDWIMPMCERVSPPNRRHGPSADELASEMLDMLLSGRLGKSYDDSKAIEPFVRGVIKRKDRSHDSKWRRRPNVTLENAIHKCADPAHEPPEVASARELIERAFAEYHKLPEAQQAAIQAQFGSIDSDETCALPASSKNHMAKHRGLARLRKHFGVTSVTRRCRHKRTRLP